MRIFAGYGAPNESGVVENGDFSLLSLAKCSEPSEKLLLYFLPLDRIGRFLGR